jgi:hypothetical protein
MDVADVAKKTYNQIKIFELQIRAPHQALPSKTSISS